MQGGHNGAVNEGKLQLLEFLRGLSYKGRHLLINPNRLLTLQQLQSAVLRADRFLDEVDEEVGGNSDLSITGAATATKFEGMVSILCLQPSVSSRLACAAAPTTHNATSCAVGSVDTDIMQWVCGTAAVQLLSTICMFCKRRQVLCSLPVYARTLPRDARLHWLPQSQPHCLHIHPAVVHPAFSPLQAMWDDVAERLTELGFERGWGATAARIREQFRLLLDILQVSSSRCRALCKPVQAVQAQRDLRGHAAHAGLGHFCKHKQLHQHWPLRLTWVGTPALHASWLTSWLITYLHW
jgi:hypothetical protein